MTVYGCTNGPQRKETSMAIGERPFYGAGMSFTGVTRATMGPASRISNPYIRWAVYFLIVTTVLPILYSGVLTWYVLIFSVFWWLVIPYRLRMREARKARAVATLSLVELQFINKNTAR